MSILIEKTSELLRGMFDEERCLFSYSTSLENGKYVNHFSHPASLRYSINALAGIQRAVRAGQTDWDFTQLLRKFLSLHLKRVTNDGDKGLLLYLLAEHGDESQEIIFRELECLSQERDRILRLNIQELSWILAGLSRYAGLSGVSQAGEAAERLFKAINRYFFHKDTLLPFHSLTRYRKIFVSFGVVCYFLWALYEYGTVFADRYAETLFREGVKNCLNFQGEKGEWPWFIHVQRGKVFDWYQLYSVHQDAMAMLFLLPALELGVEEARESIKKSFRWLFGFNELGALMVRDSPFFIYRSILRKGKIRHLQYEKGKRYLKSLLQTILPSEARKANPSLLEVNRECRSYHPGWVLFVWSGQNDFKEFTDLQLLSQSTQTT